MGQELFLGQPPKYVKSWILNKDMPAGGWTDIVKALETGKISSKTLEGIKFGGKDVAVGNSLNTPIAYYQDGKDSLIADSEWIVCGFNGAVPEYVKYVMNGCVRVFVKSTGDNGAERKIAAGDAVYERVWNDTTKKYEYDGHQIGTVKSVSDDEFTYGADKEADYGTKSIADPYSVPMTLTVTLTAGGTATAEFKGYNMQLWSNHMYLDCDAAGSYAAAEAMMNDSNQCTTMGFGNSQNWSESYVRAFLNGEGSLPSGYRYTDCIDWSYDSYQTKHSFIEKVAANSDAMLQAVCSQVNRNWTEGDKIVRTTDRFWLPGCDLMKSADSYVTIIDCYKDSVYGLCEETEFNNHLRPSYKNGSLGPDSASSCWLRSAYADYSACVASLADGSVYYGVYGYVGLGLSPACTIG